MKIVELIGIFALTATLAACDSRAPAPVSAPVSPPASTAKLEPQAAKPADAPKDSPKDLAEARYTPAYGKCLSTGEAAQGQTMAMVACAGAEIAVQDKALNQAYQATMAKLLPEQRPKVVAAQRAWIVFRDAKCASEAQTGGTIDSILIGGCVLRATVVRTLELEEMQKSWETP